MDIKIENGIFTITFPATRQMLFVAGTRTLQEAWGHFYEHNLRMARRGAEISGATVADVEKMERSIGYMATMNTFCEIGRRENSH